MAETGLDQLVDRAAQVVLELVGVGGLRLAAALHVLPPLAELGLEALPAVGCGHDGHSWGTTVKGARQISLSVSTTVSHWRRCSASSARPCSVMR